MPKGLVILELGKVKARLEVTCRIDSGWVVVPVVDRWNTDAHVYVWGGCGHGGVVGSWPMGLELGRGAGTEARQGARSPRTEGE